MNDVESRTYPKSHAYGPQCSRLRWVLYFLQLQLFYAIPQQHPVLNDRTDCRTKEISQDYEKMSKNVSRTLGFRTIWGAFHEEEWSPILKKILENVEESVSTDVAISYTSNTAIGIKDGAIKKKILALPRPSQRSKKRELDTRPKRS